MIIILSDRVSMYKIQKNSYCQLKSERLVTIHIKEYNYKLPLWKRSMLVSERMGIEKNENQKLI